MTHLALAGKRGIEDDPHATKEIFKSQVPDAGRLLLSWLPACRRGRPWPGWGLTRWPYSFERFARSCGVSCSRFAGRCGSSAWIASSAQSGCT